MANKVTIFTWLFIILFKRNDSIKKYFQHFLTNLERLFSYLRNLISASAALSSSEGDDAISRAGKKQSN